MCIGLEEIIAGSLVGRSLSTGKFIFTKAIFLKAITDESSFDFNTILEDVLNKRDCFCIASYNSTQNFALHEVVQKYGAI